MIINVDIIINRRSELALPCGIFALYTIRQLRCLGALRDHLELLAFKHV